MRKLTLLAVMLMVAVMAIPASASVQNVKVSGSIDSTWINRENFDLGANIIGDEAQNLFVTQTMLMVDADLTDNVSTSICLINERAWDQKTSASNDADIGIHLAFVTLREMLYSPLTVVVGRQAFHYGNSFIVDSAGTNNSAPLDSGIVGAAEDLTKQTAMDAIRLIFDYKPLSLEFLFSKIDSNTSSLVNDASDDVDLYGVNAGYELGDSFNTQVEAYFFAKIDKSTANDPGDVATKSDTVYVPGLRVSTSPIEGLNVSTELAWQRGNRVATTTTINDNEAREAMGAEVIASYQVPVFEEYKPVAQYVYIYVSGDSNSGDRRAATEASANKYTAWDPMFENQSGGTIYNAIYNLAGVQVHAISLQGNPIEDVTTKVTWTGLWLDKELRNSTQTPFTLVQPDGTSVSPAFNAGDKDLGYEIDFDAIYDYTEDVQLGASLGWYVPGDVFTAANNDVASQAIVHGNVNF